MVRHNKRASQLSQSELLTCSICRRADSLFRNKPSQRGSVRVSLLIVAFGLPHPHWRVTIHDQFFWQVKNAQADSVCQNASISLVILLRLDVPRGPLGLTAERNHLQLEG
jgi:hypothetical protein